MKILWILFWGHHKIGLYLGVNNFYAFKGLFLRSKYRMGDILGVGKISNIALGCLKFLICFWGERKMLGPSLGMMKKMKVPPPPPPGICLTLFILMNSSMQRIWEGSLCISRGNRLKFPN